MATTEKKHSTSIYQFSISHVPNPPHTCAHTTQHSSDMCHLSSLPTSRCIGQHLHMPEIALAFWVTPNPHTPHPGSEWAVSHNNTFKENLTQLNNWKTSSDGIWRQFHSLRSGNRATALWTTTYTGLKTSHFTGRTEKFLLQELLLHLLMLVRKICLTK